MATKAGPRPANSSSAASSADADSAERGGHSSKETKRPAPIRSKTVATRAAYCRVDVVDVARSRRSRSPATVRGYHPGRSPCNKGQRYPADPPTVSGIVAVMRHAGSDVYGARLRALIVVLWRAGLRIHEALALGEADLDPRRGSLLVRRGKGG